MTNQTATKNYLVEVEQFGADQLIKPECPDGWCLPQWCAVRPLIAGGGTGGSLWKWHGWHCAERYTTNIEHGSVAEVSAAAPMDEPDHMEVFLRLMSRQSAEEVETALTPDEADHLADALRAGARDARLIRAMLADGRLAKIGTEAGR